MNGIGNRLSTFIEREQRTRIIEEYAERAKKLGSFPGTHTLGAEFKNGEKVKAK